MSFWCITTFFNPAGYKLPVENYQIFAKALKFQGANLLTVELAFHDQPFLLTGDNIIQLRSNCIMWLKERLINYAISQLPSSCQAFAWLDADVLFGCHQWIAHAQRKLESANVIQLFKRIFHLPRGHKFYQQKHNCGFHGIVWQSKFYPNWLKLRYQKKLPFAAPGFAWAARRDTFPNGLYDRDVIGSGDCIFVDSLMNSWDLHGFNHKFNDLTKLDIKNWRTELMKKDFKIDYLPVDIFHLWHGDLRNRSYFERHAIMQRHQYDPLKDISLDGAVFKWSTDKLQMHKEIENYFHTRQEDQ